MEKRNKKTRERVKTTKIKETKGKQKQEEYKGK